MDCTDVKPLPLLTLVNEITRECYDILKKKINLVARAGFKGDFEIPDDTSISRCHAEIFYEKKIVNNKNKLILKLVDKKSKFGTFINIGITSNERIASECPIVLSSGDRIRFGIMDSFWIVTEYPFLVCPSTLRRNDKEILKNALNPIGGEITHEWTNQCTHLCMNSIIVTEKVLLCLASAKSIVPIRYFIDLYKALLPNSTSELPYCTDYVPNLTDNLLNSSSVSMNVNNKRKTLFSGKIFVCSTVNQYNRISKIIKIAGGEIIKYCEDTMSEDEILQSKVHIFMQQDISFTENNKKYQQLLEKLKLMNKTPISEYDIGLAIIHSSTTKHCNPDHHNSLINLQTQPSVSESHASGILAPETEVLIVEDSTKFSVNVIPDSHSNMQPCYKRPLETIMDSEDMMPKKRILISNDIDDSNTTPKIKAEENLQLTSYESLIPSINNLKLPYNNNEIVNDESIKSDSCITTVQTSQNSSNNDYSSLLQVSIANENVSYINSVPSETISIRSGFKRKISSVGSMLNHDDEDDPFNYKDIDEIEEHASKKPKTKPPVSLFYSMLEESSSNKNEIPKSIEPKVDNTVDPNFIMNLLSSAKGTGKCIDTSNLDDKSVRSITNVMYDFCKTN
uniref:Nibrin n=1 Tax=Sipha flava TaxID=143950 RepID=A0A2S2PZZ5_9HEMI